MRLQLAAGGQSCKEQFAWLCPGLQLLQVHKALQKPPCHWCPGTWQEQQRC